MVGGCSVHLAVITHFAEFIVECQFTTLIPKIISIEVDIELSDNAVIIDVGRMTWNGCRLIVYL